MEITTERAYNVHVNMKHAELENLVASIEHTYSTYVKTNTDTTPLTPLLAFKDELVMSMHNAKTLGE